MKVLVLVYLFAAALVLGQRPPPLPGHQVAQRLFDVINEGRDALGRPRGNVQLAAIEATDTTPALNPLFIDAVRYEAPEDADIRNWVHTEVCLVATMEAEFARANRQLNNGYVFLYTHNSPCESCLCYLLGIAQEYPNMMFYIGYTSPYGLARRGDTAIMRQQQFQAMLPGQLPPNIRFMHLPSRQVINWVFHDRIVDVQPAGHDELRRKKRAIFSSIFGIAALIALLTSGATAIATSVQPHALSANALRCSVNSDWMNTFRASQSRYRCGIRA